jgi:4-aminobutyrate aminotransferase-like enzyme
LKELQMQAETLTGRSGIADVLEKKRRYLVPSVYHFYQDAPLIVRGEGCELIDSDGHRYLDCYSGVGAMSLGHSHPDILAAAHAQIDELQHTTTIYLTEAMFDLAERLALLAPGDLNRSFFCASGTEANEAALLMASQYTGRGQFLSLEGGLHGRTKAAMSVTQIPMWRSDPFLLESCSAAPGYAAADSLAVIERQLQTRQFAAVIAEPIQGNGGIMIPPHAYWKTLRDLCDEYGTLLIADEVQTGINRTGAFFAVNHEEVTPDFITTAKALGNGFPIAACLTTDEVAAVCTKPAASTYGANPIACRVALVVLDCHSKNDLAKQSLARGRYLTAMLNRIAEGSDLITDVRGRGLMIGVELGDAGQDAAADVTDRVLEVMKDHGVLLGKTGLGRNVVTFMPPLIITEQQLDDACEKFRKVLHGVASV